MESLPFFAFALPLQSFVHPYLMTAQHASWAGKRVIHFILHCTLDDSQVHPEAKGVVSSGTLAIAWLQTWLVISLTCSRCWAKVSCTGGIFAIFLPFWVNKTCFSLLLGLPVMGKYHTSFNDGENICYVIYCVKWVGVASSKPSYADQTLHLPFPVNVDFTSHPFPG